MQNKYKTILGIIPVRGGSKGIPRKNIKKIAGQPLLYYTAQCALKSTMLNRIIVSTEDREIKDLSLNLGLEVPFFRPEKLAKDNTPSLPVIRHVLKTLKDIESYKPDIIVVLQATSPLRTNFHLDEAIKLFLESPSNSLVSVVEVPHNMSPSSVMSKNRNSYLENFMEFNENLNMRQRKPNFYARNGAIYISTYENIMIRSSLYSDKIIPYFMKKEVSYDLDDYHDFEIIEYLLNKNQYEK